MLEKFCDRFYFACVQTTEEGTQENLALLFSWQNVKMLKMTLEKFMICKIMYAFQ